MTKLITSLEIGVKIKYGAYKVENSAIEPIVWRVIDKEHDGYPSGAITLITDKIIDLRGFDAKEPDNANTDRASYGNNRYRTSNIRQWLNSGGAASDWWVAQNLTDGTTNTNNKDATPNDAGMNVPTGYDDIPGFMDNFTANELSGMIDTNLTVAKNTVTDGGGSETITDKIFLLSNTEMGLANENNIVEGSAFSFFSSDAARIAYMTSQGFDNTLSTSKPTDVSTAWHWWLRTPVATNSRYARSVVSSGALSYNYAYYGYIGVRPALNLTSDILVSDAPDGDGAYVVQWNASPTISGADADLGTSVVSFVQTYSVADTDEFDVLTIVEKVDGVTIRTIENAVRGQIYTADIESVWSELTLAQHTLTITVDDDKGGTATRTYTFTRTDDRVEFTLKSPIQTSASARKIVISGVVVVPIGATLTVKACNNGLDDAPTWEDVTVEFVGKQAYDFTNQEKTAEHWGINLLILILKGTATETIEVSGFGFSFE